MKKKKTKHTILFAPLADGRAKAETSVKDAAWFTSRKEALQEASSWQKKPKKILRAVFTTFDI